MKLELVKLTLPEVSDGSLEARFQELLDEVNEINDNALAFKRNSDGSVTSNIRLDVEITHWPSMGGDPAHTEIVSGGELSEKPKRLKTKQAAHRDTETGELVVVKNPPEQTEAFSGEGSGGVLTPFGKAANGGNENDGE